MTINNNNDYYYIDYYYISYIVHFISTSIIMVYIIISNLMLYKHIHKYYKFERNLDFVSLLKKCIICEEQIRNIVFIPCGHTIVCNNCSIKLSDNSYTKCIYCRQYIDLSIFFSSHQPNPNSQ